MSSRRDLSGFSATATKPAPRKPKPNPRATLPSPIKPDSVATKPKPSKRRRITLSLPTDTAAKLKRIAAQEELYYLDIVLAAYMDHGEAIATDLDTTDSPLVGYNPARRRRPSGRVQIPLAIDPSDLLVLDTAAKNLAIDRSSYVTELIDRR